MIEEKEYRKIVKGTYEKIFSAFESVDPDIAEVEEGLGTLSILTKKGKIILSTQPSVRQLWLAVATLGVASHFNLDSSGAKWIDDKDSSRELFSYLAEVLLKSTGQQIKVV